MRNVTRGNFYIIIILGPSRKDHRFFGGGWSNCNNHAIEQVINFFRGDLERFGFLKKVDKI